MPVRQRQSIDERPRLSGYCSWLRSRYGWLRLLDSHKVLRSDKGGSTGCPNKRKDRTDDEQHIECAGEAGVDGPSECPIERFRHALEYLRGIALLDSSDDLMQV